MEPGTDDLLPASDERREILVDNKKASEQGVSPTPRKPYGMNWTKILAEKGLESPGYQDTVKKMRDEGRIKGY